ncbi:MAG: hypothetical protein AAGI48_01165 [Verrucomicrobiota bacterium]
MKVLFNFVFPKYLVSILLLLASVAASAEPKMARELAETAAQAARILSKVKNEEGARKALGELDRWKSSILASPHEEDWEKIGELIGIESKLGDALNQVDREIARIEELDDESYRVLFEALNGYPQVDLPKHYSELAGILKGISSNEDLKAVEGELKTWGEPLFRLLFISMNRYEELESEAQGVEGPLEAYRREVRRLEELDQALAEEVGVAMATRPVFEELKARTQKALKERPLLEAKMEINMIKFAIESYRLEYERFPWTEEPIEDGAGSKIFDASVLAALTGEEHVLNPKRLAFLRVPGRVKQPDGQWLDPWVKAYRVHVMRDRDGKIEVPDDYTEVQKPMGKVEVDSAGPDGDYATVDDNLRTWN